MRPPRAGAGGTLDSHVRPRESVFQAVPGARTRVCPADGGGVMAPQQVDVRSEGGWSRVGSGRSLSRDKPGRSLTLKATPLCAV